MDEKTQALDQHAGPAAKIALFRSLFRGREDVYPVRFESRKTGKAGYSPACANEWVRDLCDKRRTKCSHCPNRRFLPVTDETVSWHLSGHDKTGRDFVMGVYPMLQDETCCFLAVDFDKKDWRQDIGEVWDACFELNIPVAVERSRSGNGAHLWIFFKSPIPAVAARMLGACILTKTMERRPDIGLDSYDRFFPNQDTLPQGGFGNLIALPLQKRARELGNSVFLNRQFEPHADQWAYLAGVRKMERPEVEKIAGSAENRSRVIGVRWVIDDEDDVTPWAAPPSRKRRENPITAPLPESLDLTLEDQIYIPKAGMPPALQNRLIRLAAFQNPEFYKAQAMRLSVFDKPRIIACSEDYPHYLGLPRGCLDDVKKLLADLHIKPVIHDERFQGKSLAVAFRGELRPEQQAAADVMAANDTGVLAATTAFGKTVLAAWLIARRGVNTLVLVHRQQLMEQWIERLSSFLNVPPKSIGRIGGGRKKPTGDLDVALIQSLVRKGVVDDRVGDYGYLVVDECHHLPAFSFELVARRVKARYITGLSATVTRKDGLHPIIFMQCGPVRHRVDARQQAALRPFEHRVIVRPTAFHALRAPTDDQRLEFQKLCQELISDDSRNRLICDDVVAAVREGRSPLVLTERVEHLDKLAEMLSPAVRGLIILKGGMGRKSLKSALAQTASVPENEERVLLATGRFIGEGFDDARLDTLFITLPVSWRGTIAQYAGRLHRLNERKREVRIYDYADLNVPMLAKMFDRRCAGYEALGYQILLPASAVPGWPPEVPLPVEPEWKREYAASVQRLIRDGVDEPLGNLFVHATRMAQPSTIGPEQSRSAAEAFLFKRLDTLRETAGLFHLNVILPIPFGRQGRMEVDLCCARHRIAIEIDGPQHLSDPNAYRRDRRKDALLQQNGYFVLRFLAEDVGKHLDDVLDAILRARAHRSLQ